MTMTRFCKKGHDKEEVGRYADGSCKACKKTYTLAWQKAHREKRRAASLAWQKANPEKCRAAARARYAANPEQVRAAVRAWRKAHPEKTRDANYRRLAKKAGNGVGLTPAYDYASIVDGATHCGICQRRYKKGDKRELDHIIPISQGGVDSRENVQSAHATCNSGKRDRIPTGTQFPLGMGS